jgi:hypothetical protein
MLVAWTTQGFLPGYPYKGTETPDRFHRRHGAPALVFSRTKGPISVRGTATLVA